jgi:predicted alpha/beta-hydrolase family hydrolase
VIKLPPTAELLQEELRQTVAGLAWDGPLIIGGGSMGGRVASMIADAVYEDGAIAA